MRVNVETRAIRASLILGSLLKISKYEALGRLVHLWEASQDAELSDLKSENILLWFDEENELIGVDVIGALEQMNFIKRSPNDPDLFEIRGNKKQIDRLKMLRESGRTGGLKSGKIRKKKSKQTLQPKSKQTLEPNTIQCNSMQFNAMQFKKTKTTIAQAELERIYQNYPRKSGKAEGLRKLRSQIKTDQDLKDLSNAVERYRAHCEREGTELRFIKHFKSWIPHWRDWLDPETGTGTDFSKRSKPGDYSYLEGQ